MNLTKFGLICLLLAITTPLFSQPDPRSPRSFEFGLLPMKIEWSSETLYFSGGLKIPIGFYLNHSLSENGLDLTGSLSFSKTNIFDACRNCLGSFGDIDLTEASITSGLGYIFLWNKKPLLKPYVQMEGHYSYVNYSGFLGTPFDEVFELRTHYHMLGTITKVGVKTILFNRMSLSVLSGFRWGMGLFTNEVPSQQSGFHLGYASSALEVRVGLRF